MHVGRSAAACLLAAAALTACGKSAFGWLKPSAAPAGWATMSIPQGAVPHPPTWRPLQSDPGTASAAERGAGGAIRGYLNVTPQQGEETLSDWRSFRVEHNRDEGDRDVVLSASATGLGFGGGHGSCVEDSYATTRNRYREIACIVAGAHGTFVVVGAAPSGAWRSEEPTLRRAISATAAGTRRAGRRPAP